MCTVEVVLREGPVLIPSLAGLGVERTYPLWDDISATEFFPGQVESAFYVLSLRKPAQDPEGVVDAEGKLVSTLKVLATAWPFSGGSFMVLESHDVLMSPRFESNAERVRAELLAAVGKRKVTRSVGVPYETLVRYDGPPLEIASVVAKAAMADPGLRRLLAYHQAAWAGFYCRTRSDRSSWFIELYKLRDLLKKLYGGKEKAKAQLGISEGDWSFFGRILNNNDLRHAEVAGVVPPLAAGDVRRLYSLARAWTRSHLKALGLPAL